MKNSEFDKFVSFMNVVIRIVECICSLFGLFALLTSIFSIGGTSIASLVLLDSVGIIIFSLVLR